MRTIKEVVAEGHGHFQKLGHTPQKMDEATDQEADYLGLSLSELRDLIWQREFDVYCAKLRKDPVEVALKLGSHTEDEFNALMRQRLDDINKHL